MDPDSGPVVPSRLIPSQPPSNYSFGRIERVDLDSGEVEVLYDSSDGRPLRAPNDLVFDAHGVTLRIANVSSVVDFKPAPFTILGWQVPSAEKVVQALTKKGVKFERFPGMNQDKLGIWSSPSGAHVAWFKDPDGNILSVTEV